MFTARSTARSLAAVSLATAFAVPSQAAIGPIPSTIATEGNAVATVGPASVTIHKPGQISLTHYAATKQIGLQITVLDKTAPLTFTCADVAKLQEVIDKDPKLVTADFRPRFEKVTMERLHDSNTSIAISGGQVIKVEDVQSLFAEAYAGQLLNGFLHAMSAGAKFCENPAKSDSKMDFNVGRLTQHPALQAK